MYDILSLDIVESGSDLQEPVSLEEAKLWLKIDGIDQDDEIERLITSCRHAVENYTHCSLIEKQVECTVRLCGDLFELPNGPIKQVDGVLVEGQDITGYSKVDGPFIKIYNLYGLCNITYSVGYDAVPARLKEAILNELAYRNQNRGDQSKENMFGSSYLCESALHICHPYKRMAWL